MSQQWSTVPADASAEEQTKKLFKSYNAKLGDEIEQVFMHNRQHQFTTASLAREIVSFRNGRVRIAKEDFEAQVQLLYPLVNDCLNHAEGPFTRTLSKRSGKEGTPDYTVLLWSHNHNKSSLFTTARFSLHEYNFPGGLVTINIPVGSSVNADGLSLRIRALMGDSVAPQLGAHF